MAIEITPKIKIEIPTWVTVLLVFCTIVLVSLLVSYFYFQKRIEDINKALVETPDEKILHQKINARKQELLLYKEKIDGLSELLSGHQNVANVFELLERRCLPNVWFSDFEFVSKTGKLTITGQADSFIAVGQQILMLKKEPFLKNLKLSEISLSEAGKVNFALLLTFDSRIFK